MRPSGALTLSVLIAAAFSPINASSSILPDVPTSILEPARAALKAEHATLKNRLDSYNKDTDSFNAVCNSVVKGSGQVESCRQQQAALQAEKGAITEAIKQFKAKLTTALQQGSTEQPPTTASRINELDRQIADLQKQLHALAFDSSVQDFAWFASQSKEAQEHLIAQLISRVREFAISKTEDEMTDHFLKRIGTMKPKEINRWAESLRQCPVTNTRVFQDCFRSLSPKASRAVLVQGAKLAIDGVKNDQQLFEAVEHFDKETVEGRQDAALTLLDMVADFPGLKEVQELKSLKALNGISAGLYDVGEAWLTYYFLDHDITDRSASIETQLATQQKVMRRMKDLIDERALFLNHRR
jgi:hypothetical protein